MSDDFRDDEEREDEITEMDENDDREIIVEGLPKATDLSNESNVYIEDEIKNRQELSGMYWGNTIRMGILLFMVRWLEWLRILI